MAEVATCWEQAGWMRHRRREDLIARGSPKVPALGCLHHRSGGDRAAHRARGRIRTPGQCFAGREGLSQDSPEPENSTFGGVARGDCIRA